MLHLPAVLLAVSLTLVAGGPARPGVTPSTTHPSAPTPCVDGGGALPVPTGEFRVGVSPLEAAESLGQVVAFYPAAACTGLHPPYLRPELVTALGLAPSTLDPIVVHAEAGAAPLAGSPRPVVLLAPGWTSLIALSTALATDLASHGYVVIAADPPLGAEATTFPDSDAAARRLEALSALLDLLDDPAVASITGPLDHSRRRGRRALLRRLGRLPARPGRQPARRRVRPRRGPPRRGTGGPDASSGARRHGRGRQRRRPEPRHRPRSVTRGRRHRRAAR
ncbi:MAG: hypothetical protein V9E89_09505 [Ilumatobacteraceae bacterium]